MTSTAPGMYAVTATITRTNAQGWQSTTHTPTIFLHSDVQGITSTEGAESIARRMFAEVAGPDATVHVLAVDCTGDHVYPGEALTVPDVRYSATTSRHQGITRRADAGLPAAGHPYYCGCGCTDAP